MFLYDEYDYLTYYDRLSSNNSARIRFWLYGRCLETVDENGQQDLAAPAALASDVYSLTGSDCNDDDNHGGKRLLLYVVRVTHSEQKKKSSRDDNQKWDFEKINPQQKVPALTITYKNGYVQSLYESSVILNYLEEFAYWYSQRHDNNKNNKNYYKTWETIQNNNSTMSSKNNNFFSLTPMNSLELRSHMQLIIRTHDLYLSSPNCASQNDWSMATHTQGCMYLGRPPPTSTTTTTTEKPPLARYLTNDIRAKKLAELWHQLNVLESYLVETEKIIYLLHHHHQKQCVVNNSDGTRNEAEEKDSAENYYDYGVGPFFCGNQISLADITIFPTFVYMNYLLPISIGWESADNSSDNKTSDNDFCCDYYCKSVFYERPRLKEWYKAMLRYVPCARRVQDELVDGLKKSRYDTGILQGIREEIEKDKHKYKWIYP